MATHIELISLNRNAKIRVKNESGSYQQLSTTVGCWIDIDDVYNRKQLNHHGSIGQYLPIDYNSGGGNTPTNLLTTEKRVPLVGLNTAYNGTNKSNIRVKNVEGTDVSLLVDEAIEVLVGGSTNDQRKIAAYNRRQLNHHRSIGQYTFGWGPSYRALNRSVKVRLWNNDNEEYETLKSTENSNTFYPEDSELTRRTLNHHASIGQFIPVAWD